FSAFFLVPRGTADSYKDPVHGFKLTSPPQWSIMTPNDVREKTRGLLIPTPGTLVFVVNEKDADENINIQFARDARDDVPTNKAAVEFFKQSQTDFRKALESRVPGSVFISSKVIEMAGGVGLEQVITSPRNRTVMKQKSI